MVYVFVGGVINEEVNDDVEVEVNVINFGVVDVIELVVEKGLIV